MHPSGNPPGAWGTRHEWSAWGGQRGRQGETIFQQSGCNMVVVAVMNTSWHVTKDTKCRVYYHRHIIHSAQALFTCPCCTQWQRLITVIIKPVKYSCQPEIRPHIVCITGFLKLQDVRKTRGWTDSTLSIFPSVPSLSEVMSAQLTDSKGKYRSLAPKFISFGQRSEFTKFTQWIEKLFILSHSYSYCCLYNDSGLSY